jgi:hypothetical protein
MKTAEHANRKEERHAKTHKEHASHSPGEKRLAVMLLWLDHMVASGAEWVALFDRTDSALVGTWKLPKTDKPGLGTLAVKLLATAESDGACQPGRSVLYELVAFRDGGLGPRGRKLLRVDAAPGGTEAHPVARPSHLLPADIGTALVDQNRQLCALLAQLHGFLSEEQARAKEERRITEERDAYIEDRLDCFLPVLMNRLLGGGPEKPPPYFGEEMVQQLLRRISPQEVEAIVKGLRPELAALFTELCLSYWDKEQTRQNADQAIGGAPSDPAPFTDETRSRS